MIFAMVGTNETPFDRLLLALDAAAIDEEMIVQCGSSSVQPQGARCIESIRYEDLGEFVRQARAVVSHGGVGAILTALANHKHPIIFPRLHRFAEAVDDHQLVFARRLEEAGLITLAEDAEQLARKIRAPSPAVSLKLEADPRLVAELREFVKESLAGHPGRSVPSTA